MSKRVLIDVDAGTDDAFALILLLNRNDIEILAITCVSGNTSLKNVYKNVQRILKLCNRQDIPVYLGASQAIIPTGKKNYFHGVDGFGDLHYEDDNITVKDCQHNQIKIDNNNVRNIEIENDFNENIDDSSNAIIMLNKILSANPGEISLLCLGPLTNVALAICIYPQLHRFMKDIFIMGGNHKGVGNVTSAAEFNFHVDPEAAYIVLNHSQCPVTILPWEPCIESTITFDWRYNVLGSLNHPTINLLNSAEKRIYPDDEKYWLPCDAFLVAAFLDSEIAKTYEMHHASVELQGQRTRAQMVLDHIKDLKPNVSLITELNVQRFQTLLLDTFNCK